MAEIHTARQAFRCCLVEQRDVLESHSPHDFLFRHREEFDGFYYIVAEPMIETTLYATPFLFVLFGETLSQVLAYQLFSIAYYLIHQQTASVRQALEDAQWAP